jgi:hypothetical protein
MPCSKFFPVGQPHQFVENFLQSLKAAFMIPGSVRHIPFAAMQVQAVRLANLCDFVPQLRDALLDWIRHDERLAK